VSSPPPPPPPRVCALVWSSGCPRVQPCPGLHLGTHMQGRFQDVMKDYDKVINLYDEIRRCHGAIPGPSDVPSSSPKPSLRRRTMWLVASSSSPDAVWHALPAWLIIPVEREVTAFAHRTTVLQKVVAASAGAGGQRLQTAEERLTEHLANPHRRVYFDPKHKVELPPSGIKARRLRAHRAGLGIYVKIIYKHNRQTYLRRHLYRYISVYINSYLCRHVSIHIMSLCIDLYIHQALADDAFHPSRRCIATKGPGFSFTGPQGGPFRSQCLSY